MRTWKDIRVISIEDHEDYWMLDLYYKDGKVANGLKLDFGNKDEDMLPIAFHMIKIQLASKQEAKK